MKKNISKIYSLIGKALCGIAGAIIGFITAGTAVAVFGFFAGVIVGYLLEKVMIKPSLKTK